MKRSSAAIIVLSLALIASNIFWFVQSVGEGVVRTYEKASQQVVQSAVNEAIAILPIASNPNADKRILIAAGVAASSYKSGYPIERDGYEWIGALGLKFNADGRLASVKLSESGGREFLPVANP